MPIEKGARSHRRGQCAVVWLANSSREKEPSLGEGEEEGERGTPFQNRTINNFSNLSPAGPGRPSVARALANK